MKTEFIPLSFEQGRTLMTLHEEYTRSNEFPWTEAQLAQQYFPELYDRVNNVLRNKLSTGQVFVKLSSRSPKDVQTGRFEQLLQDELDSLSQEQLKDNHMRCRALVRASCKMLRVESFHEMIKLLIMSERVYEDLEQEIEVRAPSDFSLSLVLREWIDIDFDLEFRGYVHNNQLNALSQYNHVCYIDEIVQNRELMLRRMLQLFDVVRPKLATIGSYVIDFTVNPRLLHDESQLEKCVLIVELNPYEIGTGSCMFDWKTEKHLMDNGPFEFRIVETKDDAALFKEMNPSYLQYLVQ